MEKDFLKYQSWKTGEIIEQELSISYPSQQKTDLVCPFDNTPIIRYHDGHGGKGYECINCEIEYSISHGNQNEVNDFAKDYFGKMSKKIIALENQKKNLETMLNHAKKKGLIGGETKNLSFFQSDKIKYNTSYQSYKSLANLAKEINETSKINKNNKANLSSEIGFPISKYHAEYTTDMGTKQFPSQIKSENNKANLSSNGDYPIRETQFTKNSRLNR